MSFVSDAAAVAACFSLIISHQCIRCLIIHHLISCRSIISFDAILCQQFHSLSSGDSEHKYVELAHG
jgi:hypothetical protein